MTIFYSYHLRSLNTVTTKFNMEISTENTRTLAFQGKETIQRYGWMDGWMDGQIDR
jgi:hypothetical protein